jgi:uncharacterized membrane protein
MLPAVALLAVALVIMWAVLFAFPPDGHERSSLLQFLGRFHPLIVHLPIGLLLLVPVLEIFGSRRGGASLRAAAGFVLSAGTLAALVGVASGWLLAYGGGEAFARVSAHMKGGLLLGIGSVIVLGFRRWWMASNRPAWRRTYFLLLLALTALVVFTGHEGGELAYGEGYLTRYLPAPLKPWLGRGPGPETAVVPAKSSETSIYATHIQRIFEASCVDCHDPDEAKGDLRLDSFAHTMEGGEDGAVIAPGNPLGSELYRRVILPPTAKGAMPSKQKKPPLTAHELRLIEWWISEGASEKMTPAEAKYLPEDVRSILAEASAAAGR